MPELPEVETISRQLNRKLRGKKIVDVKISLPKIVMVTAQKLRQAVVGQKIVRVYRRAKLVVVELENGCSMIVHLKMTGQLLLAKKRSEASNHVHVVFDFVDGSHLFFREVRQFGYIDLLSAAELAELFEKFGPEPLNKNFSPQIFKKRLQQRKRSKIKPLLLDPKFLAGIGNIYANEALFFAGINPARTAASLSDDEIKKLYNEIIRLLKLSIKVKGCSETDYVDAYGKKGDFEKYLEVYRKDGEICSQCHKKKIKRIVLGGRGTFYCPQCQNYFIRPAKKSKSLL